MDPFEIADHEAIDYARWRIDHTFVLYGAQAYVGKFLATFKEFPPSQKVGSFSLDNVLKLLSEPAKGSD
jgi:arylsulfatase